MPSDLYNRMSKTTQDFMHSYDQSKWQQDISVLSSTLASNCRRYYAPQSFVAQFPSLANGQTNVEYEESSKHELGSLFPHSTTEFVDQIVDEHAKKAVVRFISHATTRRGKTYDIEQTFVLFMIEDGTKVNKVVHIGDALTIGQLMQDEKDWAGLRK